MPLSRSPTQDFGSESSVGSWHISSGASNSNFTERQCSYRECPRIVLGVGNMCIAHSGLGLPVNRAAGRNASSNGVSNAAFQTPSNCSNGAQTTGTSHRMTTPMLPQGQHSRDPSATYSIPQQSTDKPGKLLSAKGTARKGVRPLRQTASLSAASQSSSGTNGFSYRTISLTNHQRTQVQHPRDPHLVDDGTRAAGLNLSSSLHDLKPTQQFEGRFSLRPHTTRVLNQLSHAPQDIRIPVESDTRLKSGKISATLKMAPRATEMQQSSKDKNQVEVQNQSLKSILNDEHSPVENSAEHYLQQTHGQSRLSYNNSPQNFPSTVNETNPKRSLDRKEYLTNPNQLSTRLDSGIQSTMAHAIQTSLEKNVDGFQKSHLHQQSINQEVKKVIRPANRTDFHESVFSGSSRQQAVVILDSDDEMPDVQDNGGAAQLDAIYAWDETKSYQWKRSRTPSECSTPNIKAEPLTPAKENNILMRSDISSKPPAAQRGENKAVLQNAQMDIHEHDLVSGQQLVQSPDYTIPQYTSTSTRQNKYTSKSGSRTNQASANMERDPMESSMPDSSHGLINLVTHTKETLEMGKTSTQGLDSYETRQSRNFESPQRSVGQSSGSENTKHVQIRRATTENPVFSMDLTLPARPTRNSQNSETLTSTVLNRLTRNTINGRQTQGFRLRRYNQLHVNIVHDVRRRIFDKQSFQPQNRTTANSEHEMHSFLHETVDKPHRPISNSNDRSQVPMSFGSNKPMEDWADINPLVHWTWDQTPEWYEQKMKEIALRGKRKSRIRFTQAKEGFQFIRDWENIRREENFAADKLNKEKQRGEPTLPDFVRQNADWMAALQVMDGMVRGAQARETSGKRKASQLLSDLDSSGYMDKNDEMTDEI